MLLEYNLGPSPPAIALKLYTSIPHSKLKDRLRELANVRIYKYLVLERDRSYFVKKTLILPKNL
jgi:hypothetical protein